MSSVGQYAFLKVAWRTGVSFERLLVWMHVQFNVTSFFWALGIVSEAALSGNSIIALTHFWIIARLDLAFLFLYRSLSFSV